MCPLRIIFLLFGAYGVTTYVGPKSKGKDQRDKGMLWNASLWSGASIVLFLHADLLLSLGYTQCALKYVHSTLTRLALIQ